jgi:uncharacterized membrane protein
MSETDLTKKPSNTQPKALRISQVSQEFSGPVPPPGLLAQYDKIIPGAAERILKMAENNSEHLINLDKKKLDAENTQLERGRKYSFKTVIIFALLTVIALFLHEEKAAIVIAGTTILGLVSIFISGRIHSKIPKRFETQNIASLHKNR